MINQKKLSEDIIKRFLYITSKTSNIKFKLHTLSTLAFYIYKIANFKYVNDLDKEFDILINQICTKYIEQKEINSKKIKQEFYDFIIFDSFGWSGRGVIYQYLTSILSLNKSVLIIYCGEGYPDKNYMSLINKNDISLIKLEEFISIDQCFKNITLLGSLNCGEILYHVKPWSIIPFVYSRFIKSNIRAIIDLTDHAYCFGFNQADIIYGFREFGLKIARSLRLLKPDAKYLILPLCVSQSLLENSNKWNKSYLYDESSFNIICGGSLDKFYDKDWIFLNILKKITKISNKIKIYILGAGDSLPLSNFIINNKLQRQIIYLGFKKNVADYVSQSDALLTTYPLGGGLMSQIAVHFGKPIISLIDKKLIINSVEVTANIKGIKISSFSINQLLDKTKKLLNDTNYQEEYSRLLLSQRTTQEDHIKIFSSKALGNMKEIKGLNKKELKIMKEQNIFYFEREFNLFPILIFNFLKFKIKFRSYSIPFSLLKLFIKICFLYSLKSYFRIIKFILIKISRNIF